MLEQFVDLKISLDRKHVDSCKSYFVSQYIEILKTFFANEPLQRVHIFFYKLKYITML